MDKVSYRQAPFSNMNNQNIKTVKIWSQCIQTQDQSNFKQ